MDSLEINKLVAGILVVVLIIIGISNFAEILYHVEQPKVAHYVIEGVDDTTMASASNGTAVSIGTLRVPYTFSETFNVDLSAGQIVIPSILHSFSGGTQTFLGNITLRYKTR